MVVYIWYVRTTAVQVEQAEQALVPYGAPYFLARTTPSCAKEPRLQSTGSARTELLLLKSAGLGFQKTRTYRGCFAMTCEILPFRILKKAAWCCRFASQTKPQPKISVAFERGRHCLLYNSQSECSVAILHPCVYIPRVPLIQSSWCNLFPRTAFQGAAGAPWATFGRSRARTTRGAADGVGRVGAGQAGAPLWGGGGRGGRARQLADRRCVGFDFVSQSIFRLGAGRWARREVGTCRRGWTSLRPYTTEDITPP